MATAPTLMTMEQYLKTSFHPDVHFVDGEIEERNLGESDHGHLQGLLFSWFLARKATGVGIPVIEQRIRVAASRVRICDVVVVSKAQFREQVTDTPPVICIEVLSPEDRLSRAEKVLADYWRMGVQNIWLLDPYRRAAHFYNADGLHMAQDSVLRVTGTEIALNVDELYEALDEANA